MRKLVWTIAVLGVLWGGWWMLATTALQSGLNTWLAERRAAGWQADVRAIELSGFPIKFNVALDSLSLSDPKTGLRLAADRLDVVAPAYWPADVTVRLPQTPVHIATPPVSLTITVPDAQAAVRLRPGLALELDRISTTGGALQINLPQGKLLTAQGFSAAMTQVETPETYQFALDASQLVPAGIVRSVLSLPVDWPLALDDLSVEGTVAFDAPLDRFTLENRRPQPREIAVQHATLNWGPLKLNLQGALRIDASGIPDGQLDLLVDNWRDAFDLAQKSGMIAPNMIAQAEIMLNALSNLGNDPSQLDLKLQFTQGRAFLGPIPIGPAPRLFHP
ncbi:DUF2125 domain-containing protein [Sulfitobacter geojensis]|uniref:DUF2125 domain-containing protein n=1 Tax=Sulfitobacter geojensis TaxID=1342299 RepID=UPI0036DDE708